MQSQYFQQQPQQSQGGGGLGDPNMMLGLSLLTAANSQNPGESIMRGLYQAQQMKAQQAAAQMQALQYQLDLSRFDMDRQKFGQEMLKYQQGQQAGQDFRQNVVGQEPTAQNNYTGSGLLGAYSEVTPNAALYNPNAQKGTPFDVPEKLVQSTLDPISRAKIMAAGNISQTGDVSQASSALPEYPKPFTLNEGQTMYDAQGKVIAEKADNSKAVNRGKDLRQEFINQSKDFVQVRDSFNRIISVSEKPSAAGDLALIFNYMKMLDPGSTVREGEFANAQNSAGVPERTRAMYNSVINGQRLTTGMRDDFIGQSTNLFKSMESSHEALRSNYAGLANALGVDPSTVLVDYRSKQNSQNNNANFSDAEFDALDKEMGFPSGRSKQMYIEKMGRTNQSNGAR